MSGSRDNKASSAAENTPGPAKVFDLALARRMLPLVQPITQGLLASRQQLSLLLPEQEKLDRQRRSLDWPERARRYNLREEIAACEQSVLEAQVELENLGLSLLDEEMGCVGFPTLVNNRRAFLSWQPGEDGILYWNYAGELERQPIPVSWIKQANLTLVSHR
jgi:hypothetical protein